MDQILSQEEVDALLSTVDRREIPEATTLAPTFPTRSGIRYNFRKPHRVSKDQARMLHKIHEGFARRLLANGIDERLAFEMLDGVRLPDTAAGATPVAKAVERHLARLLRTAGPRPGATTLAVVGPSGSGKTTTLAKLAVQAHLAGTRTRVVSLDGVGLAAAGQLDALSSILGVPYTLALRVDDLPRAPAPETGGGITLIDTPGVSPRDAQGLASLAELLRAARPTEVHLVLPATMRVDDGLAAARAFAPLAVDRLVFTRLDEALNYGSLVGVSLGVGLPLSYLATGRGIPNDIRPASADEVARRVLGGESPS